MKKWLNVELNNIDSAVFRRALIEKRIKFETSGCGNLTHFEVYADSDEARELNGILETL